MWKKLIFVVVLVSFVGLQLVNSLTCYSCNSHNTCLNPSTQVCNEETANDTSDWLKTIHSDVPAVESSNVFKCMNLTYYNNGSRSRIHEYLGCYNPDIQLCNLTLNVIGGNNWTKICSDCTYDKCNGNPAGTFSKSSYTIFASAMALLLAKLAI